MGSASLKVNEPSMEDILASIRRIIADDPEIVEDIEADEGDSSPLRNVLDLTERHVSAISAAAALTMRDGDEEAGLEDDSGPFCESEIIIEKCDEAETPTPAVAAMNKHTPVPPIEPRRPEPLLSSETRAHVSGAFDRLGAAVMPQGPVTVEDLLKEMLRPMLREWLDENLPAIVERLVQAEIERVSRG